MPNRINPRELQQFLNQGKSTKAMAFYYKKSESTIKRRIKQWHLKIPKRIIRPKPKKLPKQIWIPTRLKMQQLEAEYRFINIQHPPHRWYNQRSLVLANKPRNPVGVFDVLTIWYVAESSSVYFLFPTRIGIPNAPVGFKEAFAFARANATSILEQSLERSSLLARKIVGFSFTSKARKKGAVKVR